MNSYFKFRYSLYNANIKMKDISESLRAEDGFCSVVG